MAVLAVNAGSSTLKFSLHPLQAGKILPKILTGCIEGLEPGGEPAMTWNFNGESQRRKITNDTGDVFQAALQTLRDLLESLTGLPAIAAIAHRVVHGGQQFHDSVAVTDAVLAQLSALSSLAPLHQPHNLEGIRAFRKAFPALLQVACFDTAFHAHMPIENYSFALPAALSAQGIRRYGFHGLSYQFIMQTLQQQTPRANSRVLMAHLGNGASLCAARNGKSIATTMGFSALDGLIMGTRSGSIDAGVLLYLLEQGWTHDQLQNLLYKQSGLLGLSGISADMRRLRAVAETNDSAAAQLAIHLFTHRIVRESGAMTACLGGLDVLAFSGGIGEHDAILRAQVCAGLSYLGVQLDSTLNQQANGSSVQAVHAANSAVQIWVVPTDEGLVAAQDAARILGAQSFPTQEVH